MHCIKVILLRSKDVPANMEVHQLNADIVATPLSNEDMLMQKGIEHLRIQTDYFGGSGTQSCSHRKNGLYFDNSRINDGLAILGVSNTPKMDQFDVVGLGNFRTNEDFDFQPITERRSMTGWLNHLYKNK